MNCGDWEVRIALYAGGDLDPAEAQAVERHLAECAGCWILLSELRESLQFLHEGHGERIEEAHFTSLRAGVMAELRERSSWWRQVWVYGVVAAAVLIFVLARPSPQRPSRLAKVDAVSPVMKRADRHPQPAPKPPRRHAVRPRAASQTVLVKLETNNPDVVIYWITETKGDTK